MINAIGEAVMQQFIRANYNNDLYDKDMVFNKTHQVREQRPVEESNNGQKPEMNLQFQEDMKSRTNLEDGQIIIEKYDSDGKLIKKIPPGYVPFGETA
ncbi:MAG: hypothetical protein PVG70_02155 [Desulfobacterales bacterium]|jgi:hypothetical protein